MLLKIILRIIFALTAPFALLIVLTHLQPYEGSHLRALLAPTEGCDAPCFIGIRPGVTTVDEAVELLSSHEWVGGIDVDLLAIRWRWTGAQPAWIDAREPAQIWLDGERVTGIEFKTRLTLGDMRLTFGEPHGTDVRASSLGGQRIRRITERYGDFQVATVSMSRRATRWYSPIYYRLLEPLQSE
jgi:hypothetical protein